MTRGLQRPAAIVLATFAVTLSAALHIWVLAGLSQERGAPLQAYAERAILIANAKPPTAGCMCKPREPLYTPTPGWAEVQCHVTTDGALDHCRWLRESGPGAGEAALEGLKRTEYSPIDPAFRGRTATFRMDVQIWPYARA